MPMPLVLTLREASLVPAERATLEMASLVKVCKNRYNSTCDYDCKTVGIANQFCGVSDNCDINAACADTEGSFTCTCEEGYTGDGVSCQGMNQLIAPPVIMTVTLNA